MLEKKILLAVTYVILAFVVLISIRQMIEGPGPPTEAPQYTEIAYSFHTGNNSDYVYPVKELTPNDYNTLIDLSNFTFNIFSKVCDRPSILLLVLVHSSPRNYLKRRTIRETWGQTRDKMRIIFMVGEVVDESLQRDLEEEHQVHSDIVQGNFIDSYRNMTYKHVMCMKYAIYHCPQARYVLKTDDDIFVNMPTMLSFLNPSGASNLLLCDLYENGPVVRTYRSKWRVSFTEYPSRDYPPYCAGWSLLYSPDVLFVLYKEAQISRYLWIDDVHITGTLAKRVHVRHTNVRPLVLFDEGIKELLKKCDNLTAFLYAKPNIDEHLIRLLWRCISKHDDAQKNKIRVF